MPVHGRFWRENAVVSGPFSTQPRFLQRHPLLVGSHQEQHITTKGLTAASWYALPAPAGHLYQPTMSQDHTSLHLATTIPAATGGNAEKRKVLHALAEAGNSVQVSLGIAGGVGEPGNGERPLALAALAAP